MKVCTVTCDNCEMKIDKQDRRIGMGKIEKHGKFSTWWTFDLCDTCFGSGKPTFKKMFRKYLESIMESPK